MAVSLVYGRGHFVKVQVDGKTISRADAIVGQREWHGPGANPVVFDCEDNAVEAMKMRYMAAVLGG